MIKFFADCTFTGDSRKITAPIGLCGTTATADETHIYYRNTVFMSIAFSSSLFTFADWCIYPQLSTDGQFMALENSIARC